MPTPATPSASAPPSLRLHSDLLLRLASPDGEVQVKALRELKNRIIGNRTKKLSFVKFGLVPAVADIISTDRRADILIQSAVVIGSFACGIDAGVRAVLDAGVLSSLVRLLAHREAKVVDAGARSLRMIYQSELAPKLDFVQPKNMEFLVSLLNSENENVSGLGASIIMHSCKTVVEQKALCRAGIIRKLVSLLDGSLNQRDASLESISTVIKDNAEAVSEFVGFENGRALSSVVVLTKDRFPRTRLLAASCLIVIRNTCPCYLQDVGMKTKLVYLLLDLQDETGQVGNDAPFAFCNLIAAKEDLQKLAFEASAIDKLYNHLQKETLHPRRLEGTFLAMAEMCSKLECCRAKFLSLKALILIKDALTHESSGVRIAACICLKNVSRSIKSLCAGDFMDELIVTPLVQLLDEDCTSVQTAALGAIGNIVVSFTKRIYIFEQTGGVKQLVHFSKSMDPAMRLNALWALRNLIFLSDLDFKESVFEELTPSLIASLVFDSEPSVQKQVLAFLNNIVGGCLDCIDLIFTEDAIILQAIKRLLQTASKSEICLWCMHVLCNVATGNEFHKDAVMHQIAEQADNGNQTLMVTFLQSSEGQLRTVAVWTVINLTFPTTPRVDDRIVKLRSAGVLAQLKNMANDPCLEVKLRVGIAIEQFKSLDDGSA